MSMFMHTADVEVIRTFSEFYDLYLLVLGQRPIAWSSELTPKQKEVKRILERWDGKKTLLVSVQSYSASRGVYDRYFVCLSSSEGGYLFTDQLREKYPHYTGRCKSIQ